MQHLDLRTIIFISAVGTFVTGIGLFSASKVYFGRIRGIMYWAVATMLQSVGWIALALRGSIPDFISIVIGNNLIVLSVAIYLNVLARFKNNNSSEWSFYLPAIANTVLVIYSRYVVPSMTFRTIIVAMSAGFLMFACSYILLYGRSKKPLTHIFTGIMFGLASLILFARIIAFCMLHNQYDVSPFTPNTVQDISYVSFYVTALMLTFGFLLMCNDRYIEENMETQKLLEKSEERYRSIVETAQEGIWLGDENYNTVFVNKRMADILEYTVDEMTGKNAFYFIGNEDRERANWAIGRRREGFTDQHEFRFVTKSGKHIWTSLHSSPILLEDGRFTGVLIMAMDITDKFKSSEALKNSEQRLKEAQKIARIGDYHYDFKTGIWKCSHVVDEISGLTTEEIPHFEKWIGCLAPEFKDQYVKDLNDTIVLGQNDFGKYKDYKIIQAHTGLEKWIAITGEIRYDEKGMPIELFGTIQDVTDRKKEEELILSNLQLRNLSGRLQAIREEERTHIAREIHDELGQQLTAIKIETSRWSNKIKKDHPEFSDRPYDLITMVNTAITTVRKIATQLRAGLLNELGIEAAIESHTEQFEQTTGIKCTLEIQPDLENFPEEINTNVFRIYQEALTNIARHADATEINTKLFRKNGMLVLEVFDNGIGIPPDSHSKMSLGLLGMKERAALLKGEISFHNLPEKGTLITLTTPITT